MAYIQSFEFATEQREQMLEIMGRWSADAIGIGTAQRGTLAEDQSTPGRFLMAVWFESAEAAAENSARPETDTFAEEFFASCSGDPAFREFEVVKVYGG